MPSVLTVTEPLAGWVLMTIELRLIGEVPVVSLLAKFTVFEPDLTTEKASATAVGGVVGAVGSILIFVDRTPYRLFDSWRISLPVPPSMQLPFPNLRFSSTIVSSPAPPPTPDPRRERLFRTVIESLPSPPPEWIRCASRLLATKVSFPAPRSIRISYRPKALSPMTVSLSSPPPVAMS